MRLRIYAPTAGVVQIQLREGSSVGPILATALPAGDSTPCIDLPNLSDATSYVVAATVNISYDATGWTINEDGIVRYGGASAQYTYVPTRGTQNAFVRLSVEEIRYDYSCTVNFDANGGYGAPSGFTMVGRTANIPITIPSTVPTRDGFKFVGWDQSSTSLSATFVPEVTYNFVGSTSGITYTLYAIWQDESGTVSIYNGSRWITAVPTIFNGVQWVPVKPCIYNGRTWVWTH